MKMRGGGGEIVRGLSVLPDDEAMLIAKSGVIIRMAVGDISVQGPHASGVRVMSVPDDDRVNAVTLVREPETDDDTDDTDAADGIADDTAAAAEAEPGDTAVIDSVVPVIEDDSEPDSESDETELGDTE